MITTLGSATHVGLKRTNNEDSYGAFPELGLWLVADGMGGADAGEVASRIAVEQVRAACAEGAPVEAAIEEANRAVGEAIAGGQGRPGMGTTVVAAHCVGDQFIVAWVGDSRAYLWNGALKRLSRDHSQVQELVDSGVLSEAEARVHPHRNVITQALGVQPDNPVRVDRVDGTLAGGQRLLLCSDGLTGEVDDAEIARILAADDDGAAVVDGLIQAALAAGGSDNVTVVLIGPDGG